MPQELQLNLRSVLQFAYSLHTGLLLFLPACRMDAYLRRFNSNLRSVSQHPFEASTGHFHPIPLVQDMTDDTYVAEARERAEEARQVNAHQKSGTFTIAAPAALDLSKANADRAILQLQVKLCAYRDVVLRRFIDNIPMLVRHEVCTSKAIYFSGFISARLIVGVGSNSHASFQPASTHGGRLAEEEESSAHQRSVLARYQYART